MKATDIFERKVIEAEESGTAEEVAEYRAILERINDGYDYLGKYDTRQSNIFSVSRI